VQPGSSPGPSPRSWRSPERQRCTSPDTAPPPVRPAPRAHRSAWSSSVSDLHRTSQRARSVLLPRLSGRRHPETNASGLPPRTMYKRCRASGEPAHDRVDGFHNFPEQDGRVLPPGEGERQVGPVAFAGVGTISEREVRSPEPSLGAYFLHLLHVELLRRDPLLCHYLFE